MCYTKDIHSYRKFSRKCGKEFDAEYILNSKGVPVCDSCGGQIKPDVVLYEEGLNQQTLEDAVYYISHADMLIIGGTSLAVYPAAGLIDYYRGNKLVLCLTAKPNTTHYKLAELEKAGKLKAVVTQNIDGLHQAAGSKNVLELHGSVHRNYCRKCGKEFDAEYILNSKGVPVCDSCGGQIKPDVVLYEEGLNQQTLEDAVYYISHADMLIIGGTSLAVYPAAGLIDYYRGNKLVLINKSTTSMDSRADLLIQAGLGEVFGQIEV